jgi:hypothetical protein
MWGSFVCNMVEIRLAVFKISSGNEKCVEIADGRTDRQHYGDYTLRAKCARGVIILKNSIYILYCCFYCTGLVCMQTNSKRKGGMEGVLRRHIVIL